MAIYDFKPTDILFNTIKTHPSNEFFTVSGNIFYQNQNAISGENVTNLYDIPTGFVSLYQVNVQSVLMLLLTQVSSILSWSRVQIVLHLKLCLMKNMQAHP